MKNDDRESNLKESLLDKPNSSHVSRHKIGFIYNLISLIIFFVLNCLCKYQYLYIPNLQVNVNQMCKCIVHSLFALIHFFFESHQISFGKNWTEIKFLTLNGACSHFIFIFFTSSCYFIRLGTAYSILYCYAIITTVLAAIFLKEKYTKLHLIGMLVGIVSVCFITKLGLTEVPFEQASIPIENTQEYNSSTTIIGMTLAFLATLSLSLKQVLCKYLSVSVNKDILNFWIGFTGLILSIIGIIVLKETINIEMYQCIFALVLGLSTFYGNYFMFKSFEYVSLIDTLSLSYLSIFFSFIFGYIFISNTFDIFDIIGSCMLVIFNIYYTRNQIQHDNGKKE